MEKLLEKRRKLKTSICIYVDDKKSCSLITHEIPSREKDFLVIKAGNGNKLARE